MNTPATIPFIHDDTNTLVNKLRLFVQTAENFKCPPTDNDRVGRKNEKLGQDNPAKNRLWKPNMTNKSHVKIFRDMQIKRTDLLNQFFLVACT